MSASCGFQTPIDSGLYQIIKSPNTSMSCLKNNKNKSNLIQNLIAFRNESRRRIHNFMSNDGSISRIDI